MCSVLFYLKELKTSIKEFTIIQILCFIQSRVMFLNIQQSQSFLDGKQEKVKNNKFLTPFSGLSLITQELTALFLAGRICCSNFAVASMHTYLDLISLLSTLLIIWMIRFKLKSSYIKELDNMRLYFVVKYTCSLY